MKKITFIIVAVTALSLMADAQMYSTWRGPERDGYYPAENLLKEWPGNGPEMLWAYEDIGIGFSSPVITNGKIYINGMEGSTGYIYILSLDGNLIRKYPYGEEVSSNYPGVRSTPNVIGNLMYVATGHGKLICLDLNSGNLVWQKDLFNDFDGSNIRWGLTENVLVKDDLIYAAPGGETYNVVALNRHTGDLVWASKGTGSVSAYNSPQLINHNGRQILITMMQKDILALNPLTGELLWSHPYQNQRSIHPNTPIYHNGELYCFSGYGMGGTKLRLNTDGTAAEEVWFNSTLDPQMGGAVLVDGHIYASGHRNRRWSVLDWATGESVFETRDIDVGNVIFADGMLYAYTERGELALLKPMDGSFEVVGKTSVELGSDQHWAHLVISKGILYVRHGNALMAYNISK